MSNEKQNFKNYLQNYKIEKKIWKNFYQKNNIKVILNWYRYDQSHIAKHKAISELDGISCLWQFAFDGNKYYDIKSFADINFTFSKFSSDVHKLNDSKFKQQVIVGLPHLNWTIMY